MCLEKVENVLHEDQRRIFEKRFEEGYNLADNSATGQLWQIYNDIKSMVSSAVAPPRTPSLQSPNRDSSPVPETPSPPGSPSSPQLSLSPFPRPLPLASSSPLSTVRLYRSSAPQSAPSASAPSDSELSAPSTSALSVSSTPPILNLPSTSGLQISHPLPSSTADEASSSVIRQLSFDNWQFSPFKHYLKISDKTIITRKITKTKPKTPSAISGTEYFLNLRKQQDKKENKLKEKERRKTEREEKKLKKGNAKTNKKNKKQTEEKEDDEDDQVINEEDIVYARSSDDEDLIDIEMNQNICGACEGGEDWDDGDKWLGCNLCDRWDHKTCLSGQIETMSKKHLEKLQFVCPKCARAQAMMCASPQL